MSLSILMQLASCTTVWWANVPSRHIRPRSLPWPWWRAVAVGDLAAAGPWAAPRSHRFWCPVEHDGQRPHDGMNPNTTWSPGASQLTLAPTFSTTPAPSWPPMIGSSNGRSPVSRCSSEWHRPEAAILTSTSLSLGSSSSISSTLQGVLTSQRIAALVFTMVTPSEVETN